MNHEQSQSHIKNAPQPPSQSTDAVGAFLEQQLRLLDAEQAADVDAQAELLRTLSPASLAKRGLAVLHLVVGSLRVGLGGKSIVDLEAEAGVGAVDFSVFRPGDIVGIRPRKGEDAPDCITGVVTAASGRYSIALDKEELPTGRVWAVKLTNNLTYSRMCQAIRKVMNVHQSGSSRLVEVLYGATLSDSPGAQVDFLDHTLNEVQRAAVHFALAAKEAALIHGPPGTGKTSTLIEIIRQSALQGLRVLVCGPSNISVDNLVERLSPHKIPMVRLGHPARLLPSVLSHSLDIVTRSSNAGEIVKDIRKEIDCLLGKIRKTRSGRERHAIFSELNEMRKEYRKREKKAIADILDQCPIVLSTLHGAGSHHLSGRTFDVVIIDEASQALEAQCWIAILLGSKVILAGDHLQLPPTVKSKSSSLEDTLFSRLLRIHGDTIKRLLHIQYRMHHSIMSFPSKALYDGSLVADESVSDHLLMDLSSVDKTDDTCHPLIFYDTQGDDFFESKSEEISESRINEYEASLAVNHIHSLVNAGINVACIAVITPYSAQASLLRGQLGERFPCLEIGTVDGFQGREKEAIVLCLVRSNAERVVGFLEEKRRLNVAMTRPRRHLCVIGNSETVRRGSSYLQGWMDWLEEHAEVRYPTLDDM